MHKKIKPSVLPDRGRKFTRYHLWFATSSRNMASGRQTTALAVPGEPVFLYSCFKKATPGGISADFPAASHQPAALWRKTIAYLFPSLRWKYGSKFHKFCQGIYTSISSALFRVVSVILAPPMILANSRFRPS